MSGQSTQTEIREPYFVPKQKVDARWVDAPPFGTRSCHREEMKAETSDGMSTDLQQYLSFRVGRKMEWLVLCWEGHPTSREYARCSSTSAWQSN